ncbi:MAG TPA: alpha/beta-type small acid-soluble spore protein [Tepidimicrobium sp.]|nr:alpha/beta-type small acid-soluble spore protein [Tepidimicrobium sp.]
MANNRILVPEAKQALEQLKLEIASELGIENYNNIDKGDLPSRVNGYVGGHMVRKLVEDAQNQIANK